MIRLAGALVVALALSAEGADMKLTLGTATPGGGFPVYGDAVIAAVREVDPALQIEPRNTKGSTENVPLLERNELGLDQERDFQAVYLERAGDGPAMVQDGRVAALWGGGVGWPGFTAVAKAPGGARFIVPDADGLRKIQAKHLFLKPLTVPAGSYPGQDAPIQSLGSWSFIMARPGLSDDAAYRVAKALHQAEAGIARRLAQGKETTAANTAAAAPRAELIHPGVRRYLGELGLLTR